MSDKVVVLYNDHIGNYEAKEPKKIKKTPIKEYSKKRVLVYSSVNTEGKVNVKPVVNEKDTKFSIIPKTLLQYNKTEAVVIAKTKKKHKLVHLTFND